MTLHRDSQKRYYSPDKLYFITTKTDDNFPYFKEPIFCELFINELKLIKELKRFYLYGFCLLYNHVHLLIRHGDEFNISQIMQSIKKEFSRDANNIIEGDIPECRLQRYQPSVRYEKSFNIPNIASYRNRFVEKYQDHIKLFPGFKWQKSFHDHVIRNDLDFQNHYLYTTYNYNKHQLPLDWPYTSTNHWDLIDDVY